MINESKNIEKLYHFTYTHTIISILRDNKLLLSNNWVIGFMAIPKKYNRNYISLTRDKNLHLTKFSELKVCFSHIQIDAKKLSDKYKLIPFAYFRKRDEKTESEEAVLLKDGSDGINKFSSYITHIFLSNKEQFKEEISTYIANKVTDDFSFIHPTFDFPIYDITDDAYIYKIIEDNKIYDFVIDRVIEYCNIYNIKYSINK